MVCHGAGAIGGGTLPDLRFSSTKTFESWKTIVLKGALRSGGMPAFDKLISSEELEKIRLYIIKRANDFANSNLTNN